MSPEAIAAVLTGLTSLLVAVGAILTGRTRRVAEDVDQLKLDVELLQGQVRDALRHIASLEYRMAGAGLDPPPRPASLTVLTGGRGKPAS